MTAEERKAAWKKVQEAANRRNAKAASETAQARA